MKFFKFRSKPRKDSHKKIARVAPTRSIYLRRSKLNPSEVKFFTKDKPAVLRTLSLKGAIRESTKRSRSSSVGPILPLAPDEVRQFNPFLFPSRSEVSDHCSARLQRRSVLFASGVAGIGKRRSPGKDGHYGPSEGPCERRI